MKKIFITLVIITLALQALWFFLPYTWNFIYNKDELALLSWHGYGAYFDIDGPIPYLILVLYGVVSIGLIYFKKWARTAFVVITVASIVSTPLWGFAVSPAIDGIIGYIISISDGAILAIAFLTGLGAEFENNA
jgi:hypothetical protein